MNHMLEALFEIFQDRRTSFERWRDRIVLGIFVVTFYGIFFYGLYTVVVGIWNLLFS